jgi:hypothetical protein
MGTLLELSTGDRAAVFSSLKEHFKYCFEYGPRVHVYTKDRENDLLKIKKILSGRSIEFADIHEQTIPFDNVFTFFCENIKEQK